MVNMVLMIPSYALLAMTNVPHAMDLVLLNAILVTLDMYLLPHHLVLALDLLLNGEKIIAQLDGLFQRMVIQSLLNRIKSL